MKSIKVARVIAYGGLGNQLFQYSFAHYLTAKYESVILENTGLEFRNCQYMLKDLQGTCKKLKFNTHRTLSYDNMFARVLLKTKISPTYSNILLKNKSFKNRKYPSLHTRNYGCGRPIIYFIYIRFYRKA